MHPPFFVVDHKVGHHPDDFVRRPFVRRGGPARLVLEPAPARFAPVPFRAPAPSTEAFASGGRKLHLAVVPPPQPTARDVVGRLLIRIGQRMILRQHVRGV